MEIPASALNDFKALTKVLESKYPVKPGLLCRAYLHWTVAPHGVEFKDYNLEVVLNAGKLAIHVTGNPQDNAPGLNNNAIHSHTWHRNTGAIGISIDGMDGATVNDFGKDAPSELELLYLCGALAAASKAYGFEIDGHVTTGATHGDNIGGTVNTKGEKVVLTHGECAVIDKYPTERWDLGTLEALPAGMPLTPAMRTASGDKLRACAHRIKLML